MAFAATVTLYDNGPHDPVTEKAPGNVGALIATNVDVAIEVHEGGWRGTFMASLPLQLAGLYWIETAGKNTAPITVLAANPHETSFIGHGPSPF